MKDINSSEQECGKEEMCPNLYRERCLGTAAVESLLPSFKLLFKRQEDKVAVALLVAPYHKRLKFSRFLSILLSGALFFPDNPFCLLSIFYAVHLSL